MVLSMAAAVVATHIAVPIVQPIMLSSVSQSQVPAVWEFFVVR
jgi:hypothetical protein